MSRLVGTESGGIIVDPARLVKSVAPRAEMVAIGTDVLKPRGPENGATAEVGSVDREGDVAGVMSEA